MLYLYIVLYKFNNKQTIGYCSYRDQSMYIMIQRQFINKVGTDVTEFNEVNFEWN